MKQYKKEITDLFYKMNKEEQLYLYNKLCNGDETARDTIIQNCLPLVIKIAENYYRNNKHIDIDDMIQEGNIALIKAVDNWNINKGNITTVATWYIQNSLNDMINDARYKVIGPYSLSRKAAEDLRKINKTNSNDINEISTMINMKPKRVKRLVNAKRSRVEFEYVKDIYKEEEIHIKKCIVDLYELVDSNLYGLDKEVFCLYIGRNGKKMKIKEICLKLDMIEQDVKSIIYRCKTKLRKIVDA